MTASHTRGPDGSDRPEGKRPRSSAPVRSFARRIDCSPAENAPHADAESARPPRADGARRDGKGGVVTRRPPA
jgi:hypothetical protein